MEKTYGSSTEDYLRNIPYKTDTDKILKEIAQNLAYIADELSQGNEERHKIGNDVFCVRDFLECDLGPIIHGSHNSNDNDSEGEILGKPHSKESAISMLNHLQGKAHQVYTSVSFVWEENDEMQTHTFFECTEVEVLPMTEQEIAYYVSLNTCMDKAGAYGIQNEFACYVKGIKGDYNNVVGLPMARLYQEVKQMQLKV